VCGETGLGCVAWLTDEEFHDMMHDVPADPIKAEAPATYHAVVWLDHHEARIIHFSAQTSHEEIVRPANPPRHLHIKAGSASGTHIRAEPAFYRDIAAACDEAQVVLLVGPSTAKNEFMTFLNDHLPQTAKRIVGIEPMDKLTDHQLLAEGRRYFKIEDSMTTQIPR
jgi:stalled ribosome rescue protein Dom34